MKHLLFFLSFFLTLTSAHAQWDWLKEVPGTIHTTDFYGITTDAAGDVYVCGSKLDNSGGPCYGGTRLVKYKPNGTLQYDVTQPGNCIDQVYDVAVDASSNKVFVCGTITSQPAVSIFEAVSGNYSGQLPITMSAGGTGDVHGMDFAGGRLYVIGNYNGTLTIPGLPSITGNGIFVAKFKPDGTGLLLKRIYAGSLTASLMGYDIKSVVSNGVCISLSTRGNITFQGGGSTYVWSGSGTDYLTARLGGTTFNNMWCKKFYNTPYNNVGVEMPLAYHSSYSSGVFCGFGQSNSTLASKLVKFSLGGVQQALQTYPNRCIRDITMSPCGKVFTTGFTFGPIQQNPDFLPCWLYPTNMFLSGHANLDGNQEWLEQSTNVCAVGQGVATGQQGNPYVCFNTQDHPPLYLGSFTVTPVTKAFTALFKTSSPCCSTYNTVMDFDGVNDYIQATNSPLTGNASFTIEAWFRTNATGTNFRRLTGWGGTSTRFEIGVANGKIALYYFPPGIPVANGIKTVNDNLWHHVAVTRSGNTTTVYVDGVQDLQKTTVGTLNLGLPFRVGRWPGAAAANQDWKGQVDEVRVWNSVRSLSDIINSRFCRLAGTETGLVLYYPFEEGLQGGANGNTCQNGAANGPNNGTLFNFAQNGNTSNWVCSDLNIATCIPFVEPGDRNEEEEIGLTRTRMGVVVYPNPAFDQVSIQLKESSLVPVYIRMMDLTGKLVKSGQFNPGDLNIEMDIQELPPSIYFLELNDRKGMKETIKVMKQ